MDQSHDTAPLLEAADAIEKQIKLEHTYILAMESTMSSTCPGNNSSCKDFCGVDQYQCLYCGTNYCTYGCLMQDLIVHRESRMCDVLRLLKRQKRRRQRREFLLSLALAVNPFPDIL